MVTEVTTSEVASPAAEVVQSTPVVEEAPVAEVTPAVAEVPVPTTPIPAQVTPVVAPVVPPAVQQYIAKLEQQTQEAKSKEDIRVLETTVAQYAKQLEEQQGLTPEQARYIADREGQRLYQQYQTEQFRQGQINAAFEIGKEFGVDPRTLMNLPTPDAMKEAAKAATAQNTLASEVEKLRAEIAALKKGNVPAQAFASGAVSGDGAKLTADNIDAMYLKDPVRYGEAYRIFLRTGQI
jgi:hypothetical protein